jgi:glucose repression mediator protein
MGDLDGGMSAYEQALRHNQWSIPAMSAISSILRTREQFPKAIEYLQNILKLDPQSGETWGSLGKLKSIGKIYLTEARLT